MMATVGVDYQPKKRKGHTSHVIEGNLYMWGGNQENFPKLYGSEEKKRLTSCVEVLDLSIGKWCQQPTSGKPPLAVYDYSSAVIGKDIYYFGGYFDHGYMYFNDDCYHNSLYRLNVGSMRWSEVSPTTTDNGPMKKRRCGMAAIRINDRDLLIVIGGEGPTNNNTSHQHNALYEESSNGRNVYTNEIHYFDLFNDEWTSIKSTGQCPPPCCRFTVTSINDNTIILFGGETPNGRASNDIFIGTCSSSTINWQKVSQSDESGLITYRWPKSRWCHATTLLDEHHLLVVGGDPTSDSWIFDITRRTWKELMVPYSFTDLLDHSLSVANINSSIAWVIVFGGSSKYSFCNGTDTLVIELRRIYGGEWSAEYSVMKHPLKGYEKKLEKIKPNVILSGKVEQEQLQQVSTQPSQPAPVRKTPSLEYYRKHQEVERKLQHLQMEKQQMEEKIHEQERIIQQFENSLVTLQVEKEQKDQQLHQYRQANLQLQQETYQLQQENYQLQQEKGHLQQEKDQLQQENYQVHQEKGQLQQENYQLQQEKGQLQQENYQVHQEKNQQLYHYQQNNDQLQHQFTLQLESSWMITRDEIHITQEVIGRGGWGEVRVANFRGLRVAAKCLHDLIISHYNISIFNREMDIASKVRHPNLLQFIGATREGTPPIILCELMPTSLNHQLQTNPLTRPQIIRISQDVSCALNYLHLYRPHPILHRDVSSSNVLLQPSVDGGWKAKLSDHGLAHNILSNSAGPGNPVYSAPEAQFPDNHSPAMDVYSCGVLLMEMVLCQSPSSTTSEREHQANTISWRPMKQLVKCCINRQSSNRPSIAVVLEHLKTL